MAETGWTPGAAGRDNPLMARYTFPAYNKAPTPRYVVVWDLQWQVLDSQRLEPGADLRGAMAAAIERLKSEGWEVEGSAEYGFVFVRRAGERRLLAITERDPYSTRAQSFNPFLKNKGGPSL
jgi:hypothetical protein